MIDTTHGSNPIDTAKKCFAENNVLYGNADKEKFNLYNGLANLAIAIEQLQAQLNDIQAAIRQT